MPVTTEQAYSVPTMARFSFTRWFVRNSTTRPTPAPAHKPATQEPNYRLPSVNSSVKITDAAQFGISPMSAVRNG